MGEVSQGVMHITVTLQDVSKMAARDLTVVVFVFNWSPVEMAQWMMGTMQVSHFYRLPGFVVCIGTEFDLVVFIGTEFDLVVFIGAEFDLRLGLGEKDKGQCKAENGNEALHLGSRDSTCRMFD